MLHLIMVISTLVMTAVRVFGEFIQKALQDSGLYSVALVNDQEELFGLVRTGEIQTAILDMELESNPVELVNRLKEIDPELAIILFNDKKDVGRKNFKGSKSVITFRGVPRSSDLMNVLETITGDVEKKYEDIKEPEGTEISYPSRIIENHTSSISRQAPDWLGDVNDVAQILTRLTLESAAHATLITRNIELWAYAGHLSRLAAEELAQSLWHYWERGGGSDLAQFILLEATHQEYILYATGLGGEYVLGLAFEAAIPFSEMRMQASILAKKLTAPPNKRISVGEESYPTEVEFADEAVNALKGAIPSVGSKEDIILKEENGIGISDDWIDKDLTTRFSIPGIEGVGEVDLSKTSELRDSFDDYLDSESIEVLEEADEDATSILPEEEIGKGKKPSLTEILNGSFREERKESDSIKKFEPLVAEQSGWDDLAGFHLEPEISNIPDSASPSFSRKERSKAQGLQDPQKSVSFYPNKSELAYACVLLPRIPYHYLMGDLELCLKQWVKLHAVAFGWRLEQLVIKRDYLHWVGILSPDLAPGKMVKDLRNYSSEYIYNDYPRFVRDNPSGDFWAPGSLIINHSGILSEQVINNYQHKTREWQGIKKDQWDNLEDKSPT